MKVLSSLLLTFIFILTGCGNTSSEKDMNADTSKYLNVSAPTTSSNAPVGIEQYVTLIFSASIDAATVNTASVYITDKNNIPIAAELTVLEEKISIIPNEFFSSDHQYAIVVTTAVKDIKSRTLENPFTFTFLTASDPDTTAPTLLSVIPASGTQVATTTQIIMAFDENIAGNGILQLRDSDTNVIVNGTSSMGDNTLRFVPDSALIPDANYTVALLGTVEDLAGNTYAGITSWDFSVNPLLDSTAPTLVSLTPDDGTSADKATDISMAFDEVIANAGAALKLTNDDTHAVVSGTSTVNNNMICFIPDSDLISGNSYTATVLGSVRDLAGNTYTGLTSWSFSVIAASDLSVISVCHSGRVIRVKFSEHLDTSTVSESDFAINGGSVTFDHLIIQDESNVKFIADSKIDGTEDISVSGTIKDIYGNYHNNGVTAIYNLGR